MKMICVSIKEETMELLKAKLKEMEVDVTDAGAIHYLLADAVDSNGIMEFDDWDREVRVSEAVEI